MTMSIGIGWGIQILIKRVFIEVISSQPKIILTDRRLHKSNRMCININS